MKPNRLRVLALAAALMAFLVPPAARTGDGGSRPLLPLPPPLRPLAPPAPTEPESPPSRTLSIPRNAAPDDVRRLMEGRSDWLEIECLSDRLDADNLAALAACSEAATLKLSNMQMDMPLETLMSLAGFGGLRVAELHIGRRNADMTRGFLAALAKANPNLIHVGLSGMNVAADDIAALAGCPELERLILYPDDSVRGEAISIMAENCQKLRTLYLGQGMAEGTMDLEALTAISGLPLLESLWVNATSDAGDDAAEALGAGLPNLRALSLYGAAHVTSRGVAMIVEGMPLLTTLRVGNSANIGDEALASMAGRDRMRCVSFNVARDITGAGLRHLAGMDRLYDIDVSGSRAIFDEDLAWMAENLPGLLHLYMGPRDLISAEAVEAFRARRPRTQLYIELLHPDPAPPPEPEPVPPPPAPAEPF